MRKLQRPSVWNNLQWQCLLKLHSENPNVDFILTKEKNPHHRHHDLLRDDCKRICSVPMVSRRCLLHAIKYESNLADFLKNPEWIWYDKQVKAWDKEVELPSNETRKLVLAVNKAVKTLHESGQIHGGLDNSSSFGIIAVLPSDSLLRTWENNLEVVLLDKRDKRSDLSDKEIMEGQQADLRSLAITIKRIFKVEDSSSKKKGKVEKDNTPPLLSGWFELVQQMGKKDLTLMWKVATDPCLWCPFVRRRYFEVLWLELKRDPSLKKDFEHAVNRLTCYYGWQKKIPESGPFRRMLKRKSYANTPFGLYHFMRSVYRHIADKKKPLVALQQDGEGSAFKAKDKEVCVAYKGNESNTTERNEETAGKYKYIEKDETVYMEQKFVEMKLTKIFPMFLQDVYRVLLQEYI